MSIGAPVESPRVRFWDRFQPLSEHMQRIWSAAHSLVHRRRGMKRSRPGATAAFALADVPELKGRANDYAPLPPRSFDWLSLEELTAEAVQSGLLTSHEWDGTWHGMTILGQRYTFTSKQARAFLFGVLEGQRVYARRVVVEAL